MEQLKVGIIGTGGISGLHMSGYKELERQGLVKVTAVCDIDGEKVKKYAERHGVERYYTDCREMMANEETVVEDDDYRFRYTDYTSKGLDQKRLKEERPEVHAEYNVDRNCKRFTFTVFG